MSCCNSAASETNTHKKKEKRKWENSSRRSNCRRSKENTLDRLSWLEVEEWQQVRPQKVKLHFIKIQMVFSLAVCLFSMRDKQQAKSSSNKTQLWHERTREGNGDMKDPWRMHATCLSPPLCVCVGEFVACCTASQARVYAVCVWGVSCTTN